MFGIWKKDKLVINFEALVKSFMFNMKNYRPRIDPFFLT